jgi:outer membrane protein
MKPRNFAAWLPLLFHPFVPSALRAEALDLDAWLDRVWTHNEEVQVRMLGEWAAREEEQGTRGQFEPTLVLEGAFSDINRQNTVEQALNLGDTPEFLEDRWQNSAALEMLVPTGAKLRLQGGASAFENNLNRVRYPGGENLLDLQASIRQPLLKDGGTKVTLAEMRAAAVNSRLAYQEYRRGVAEVLAGAESLFWDLFQAQEQAGFARDSLANAEALVTDSRKRLELGMGSEIDVLRAESGVALRQAVARQAGHVLFDVRQRMAAMAGRDNPAGDVALRARQTPRAPQAGDRPPTADLVARAFAANPEYAGLMQRLALEELRVGVAANQRLPRLDLIASTGVMGIGEGYNQSWDRVNDGQYPNWSVGLEFRYPLGGDIRAKHRSRRAELELETARKTLAAFEVRLVKGLRSALDALAGLAEMRGRYQEVVAGNKRIFESERARLEAGQSDSRRVLEAEQDLFKARIDLADVQTQYQKALVRLALLDGGYLAGRGYDLSPEQLRERTSDLAKRGRLDQKRLDGIFQRFATAYERQAAAAK